MQIFFHNFVHMKVIDSHVPYTCKVNFPSFHLKLLKQIENKTWGDWKVGLDEGQMEKYRSDGEVGVQLYVACTALQPAIR